VTSTVVHASALAAKGNLTRALEEFAVALALAPADPRVHLGRATALLTTGKVERLREAIADCDRALELAPTYAPAYAVRGQGRMMSGDPRGLADLERFVELAPRDDPNLPTIRAILDMARCRKR
jgi:Flp pilus assembly protein TadD